MAKETKVLTREERLAEMCKRINNDKFGGKDKDAITFLGSNDAVPLERWTSGNPDLDDALGGGWPKGRMIELYGGESGGKTTIALHAIAEHQKKYPDQEIALIDTEYSFDSLYAEALGVDTRYLIVNQPESGEQALNIVLQLVQNGVGLIIVDSVAGLTTKNELEGDMGDTHMAEQARLMSPSLRRLVSECGSRDCTVIWTNQIRDKIGVTYGEKSTTPGGHALKFYASIRCQVRKVTTVREKVDGEEEAVANEVSIETKKNKTAPPFRKATVYIVFGKGMDPIIGIVDNAFKHGILTKKGAWCYFNGVQISQGRGQLIELLTKDRAKLEEISKCVAEKKAANPIPDVAEDTESEDGEETSNSKKVTVEDV